MLKDLKDEVSSASVEKVFDEIVEIHLENEEKQHEIFSQNKTNS